MKKIITIIGIMAVCLMMCSCTSKEEKIASLIKNEMFEKLYNFDSYQPISTKIDTLRNDVYGDTINFDNALKLQYHLEELVECSDKLKEQLDFMNIYRPTRYYSSSSRCNFNNYRNNAIKVLEEQILNLNFADSLKNEIKAKEVNGKEYGWIVTHKFRCKTKGGNSDIVEEVYYIDSDCSKVIRTLPSKYTYEDYKTIVDGALESNGNAAAKTKQKVEELINMLNRI